VSAAAATTTTTLGANVGRLQQTVDTVTRGFMAVPPQAPRGFRVVIGSGG
jgi:hypothetical protein